MNDNNNIYDGRNVTTNETIQEACTYFPVTHVRSYYLHNRFYVHVSTMYNNSLIISTCYSTNTVFYRPYTMKSRPWYNNFSSLKVYSRVFLVRILMLYVLIVTLRPFVHLTLATIEVEKFTLKKLLALISFYHHIRSKRVYNSTFQRDLAGRDNSKQIISKVPNNSKKPIAIFNCMKFFKCFTEVSFLTICLFCYFSLDFCGFITNTVPFII